MIQLLKLLKTKKRLDLAKKIILAEIKMHQIPMEMKDDLVQRMEREGIGEELSNTSLNDFVLDLITMTTPSYNMFIEYLVGRYKINYPVAEQIADIVRNI